MGVRDHPADPARDVRRLRRALGVGHLGARRPGLRVARAGLPGRSARARRGRPASRDRDLLRPLRQDLRGALPVRLLRPGDGPGPELGSRRDAGLHHLPRRAAAAQRPHRAGTTRPLDGHRARDGPHVVRRPRHHDVVGGHLAPGVLRRLPRLPRLRGGRRHRGRLRRLHDRPEARGVRRRRAPVHPPRRPARRGRAGRGRGLDELRLAVLRQGQLRAPSAGHLDRRRRVLRRRERLPVPAPVAQRHPRRLRHRPGRRLRPRRPGLGGGVAAPHRLRHAPGHA